MMGEMIVGAQGNIFRISLRSIELCGDILAVRICCYKQNW